MSWTDERVEKLKELWAEGMSASKIAKELGGVTRNAVIGKVHRLGLSNRTAPAARPPRRRRSARPADAMARGEAQPAVAAGRGRRARDRPEPGPLPHGANRCSAMRPSRARPGLPTPEEESARATLAEIEKMARKLTLLELTERTCKWPIGDPNDDDFHFCGLPAVPGKPYCEHHVGIAFQPMSTRRDRARARTAERRSGSPADAAAGRQRQGEACHDQPPAGGQRHRRPGRSPVKPKPAGEEAEIAVDPGEDAVDRRARPNWTLPMSSVIVLVFDVTQDRRRRGCRPRRHCRPAPRTAPRRSALWP